MSGRAHCVVHQSLLDKMCAEPRPLSELRIVNLTKFDDDEGLWMITVQSESLSHGMNGMRAIIAHDDGTFSLQPDLDT